MKRLLQAGLGPVVAVCLVGTAGARVAGPAVPRDVSVAEQYLFAAANMERAQRGLPVLRWDEGLRRAAGFHAREMAAHGQIAHQYSGEPELTARGAEAGAKFSRIAENVAEAPSAVTIHDLWMKSKGHRENLLDAGVDSVGIAVVSRGGELFAVEDFDRSVRTMSFNEQEHALGGLLVPFGLRVQEGTEEARETCAMKTGYRGERRALFVMRFTASELNQLPQILKEKMRSGRYREAAVGACPAKGNGNFSVYNVAVLLYP